MQVAGREMGDREREHFPTSGSRLVLLLAIPLSVVDKLLFDSPSCSDSFR